MHSYGGVVGTDALAGLGKEKQDSAGGVTRLIYMSAFVPFENQSLAGMLGDLPPYLTPEPDGTLKFHDPATRFYSNLEPAERLHWAEQLVAHPTAAQTTNITNAAWREIPTTYVLCEKDQALPPQLQEMMVQRLVEEGIKVHLERCASDHSPFLSMPGRIVEVVVAA